jgi:hypothetical protein
MKKQREKFCTVRDKGRAKQKLEKCLNRSYVYEISAYCN